MSVPAYKKNTIPFMQSAEYLHTKCGKRNNNKKKTTTQARGQTAHIFGIVHTSCGVVVL